MQLVRTLRSIWNELQICKFLIKGMGFVGEHIHAFVVEHKIDAITKCDKVCFCVYDKGYHKEGEWALNINNVVVFGRISLVKDEDKARWICTNLCRKFTDDESLRRNLRVLCRECNV